MHQTATIVGASADRHVTAVLDALRTRRCEPTVLDATSLGSTRWSWRDGRFLLEDRPLRGRGWIRRLHPRGWQPADATTWLDVLSAAIRTSAVGWLTTIDHLLAAENAFVQDAAARRALVRAPGTRAAAGAPQLLRERLDADRHLRVVTMRDRAWVCAREASPGGVRFRPERRPNVADDALRLARLLRMGYSSQDWIESDDAAWFVALNPSGDWLFLPDAVADSITNAFAAWLAIDDAG